MRKAINISALVLFVWLILDSLNIPHTFMMFVIMGELPGTNFSLPPTVMLSIMTLAIGILLFEFFARRMEVVWRIRQHLRQFVSRYSRLPKRRFNRI